MLFFDWRNRYTGTADAARPPRYRSWPHGVCRRSVALTGGRPREGCSSTGEHLPDSQDDLAVALGRRFVERRDVKAVQHSDGSYAPDRTPFTKRDLRAHVDGSSTLGHYVVSQEGNSRVMAFDIDLNQSGTWTDELDIVHEFNPREAWLDASHPARREMTRHMRCLAEGLAWRTHRLVDVPVAVSYSGGKGMHVYGFLGSVPAADARAAAREVLDTFGCFEPTRGENFYRHSRGEYSNLSIEIYPKQDSLAGKDLGNLLRLPLGINRRTGQQAFFVRLSTGYETLVADNPATVLDIGSCR